MYSKKGRASHRLLKRLNNVSSALILSLKSFCHVPMRIVSHVLKNIFLTKIRKNAQCAENRTGSP